MSGRRATGCTDFERGQRWLRREVLRVGVAGLSAVPLANALAATPAVGVRARSVLFFHHYGAPSHIDAFDPKPDAPAEIRGEFATIGTAAPGFHVTEIMPRIARVCEKNRLMPAEDQAFSALIEDLDARGLLAETLVVWSGEFGRKPHIGRPNPVVNNIGPGGRDHWPQCYSLVLAGAGVKRGCVYSESDKIGEYPRTSPHTPGDMAATIFHALGLDPHDHLHDRLGRPFPLADGEPIEGVFA